MTALIKGKRQVKQNRSAGRKLITISLASCMAIYVALAPGAYQPGAQACGPFFDQTAFSMTMHPDLPLKLYAGGKIGILQPSYDLSYQIVAYRYFTGKPLTAAEQAAYVSYWHDHFAQAGMVDTTASDQWMKDKAKVTGQKVAVTFVDAYRSADPEGFNNYLNCPPDAFRTASATLAKLVAKYGATSPVCKEWLNGQEAVFCHCSSPGYDYKNKRPNAEPPFPGKLPESAQLELRQDRLYQMAAAYFYAQKLDDAMVLFNAIADDKTSPWQTIARYMVARTLVRKGTLTKKDGFDTDSLGKALALLKQLDTNPGFSQFKKSIDGLIDFVEIRLQPVQATQSLSKELSNPYNGNSLADKLDDYIFAMGPPPADSDDGDSDKNKVAKKAMDGRAESLLQSDDLTSWILSLRYGEKSSHGSAAQGFKMHHNLPWAIALASKLDGSEAEAADVEAVLAKVGKNEPGFISASFYRASLLLGAKRYKDADAVIAAALASPDLTPSAGNDLNYLKLGRAASLDQFYSLSFRPPAAILNGADTNEVADDFDAMEKKNSFAKLALNLLPESAAVINSSFPLAALVEGVTSKSVAPAYVKQFAQAAFTRAILLGDFATALKMTPVMKQSYPTVARQISDFENAQTPADKEFAAVFLMLKCPGMRPTVTGGTGRGTEFDHIDDYQDNWWDKDSLTSAGDRGGNGEQPAEKDSLKTPFLTAADTALAKSQLAKIAATGEAPNYMGKVVIAYAKSHAADPRVPEALALTVKATHFGSSDQSKTTKVSTEAFQILHRDYKGNVWTKKTPYHY